MCNLNKNIVLIGMPGCGKTTLGQLLSKHLGIKFIDVDCYVEQSTNKTIPELFEKGEEHFRRCESEAIKELSKEKGIIISTGGGVIKNPDNMAALKKNGTIIFIDRPIEDILTDPTLSNRPLLKGGVHKIYDLLNERYDLYKKYCDFRIVDDKSIEDALKKIVNILILRTEKCVL